MKAIWDSDLIEIYKLREAKGPEHSTKTNRVSYNYRDGQDLRAALNIIGYLKDTI